MVNDQVGFSRVIATSVTRIAVTTNKEMKSITNYEKAILMSSRLGSGNTSMLHTCQEDQLFFETQHSEKDAFLLAETSRLIHRS